MRIIGNIIKGVIALAMIVGVMLGGVFIYSFVQRALPTSTTQAAIEERPVSFEIKSGENTTQIADNLQKLGVIDNAGIFKLQLKMSGQDGQIKAGTYQLTSKMDNSKVIAVLTAPIEQVAGLKFTVIEGWRLEETAEKLGEQGIISPTHFMELAGTAQGAAQFSDQFMQDAKRPEGAGLEGYLFPDTYEIKKNPGDNSEAIIKLMYSTMEERITPKMVQDLAAKKRTVHQMLSVAAIVQREGILKEELPKIAAVYWNRVDQGIQLGADPTIQYALGKSPAWWPVLNLDPHTVDTPYNTYVEFGLPPGPICAPGLDAITASVYPEETNLLYFVAKNDGTNGHAFAHTLEEHERNRQIYGNK